MQCVSLVPLTCRMFWLSPAAHAGLGACVFSLCLLATDVTHTHCPAFAAVVTPQFNCDPPGGKFDCSDACPCIPVNGMNQTVSSYVSDFLGQNYDNRWYFTLSTFLIAMAYRVLIILAQRYISHLKR